MSEIRRSPASVSVTPTLRYGDRLGRFIINGFAGKGATSYVYRARHEESLDPVAVKVLHPALVNDEVKRRRFLREAEMMIRFDHPNIVYFHEIFEVDNQLAFVMEYLDGLQLDQWLRVYQDDLDEITITCLFLDILRGLSHAHNQGVYHRDLKPANIMITKVDQRWIAKIIDFGVARVATEPIPQEDQSKIVGTAAYISPEEILDPRTVCKSSDLYSIGVMMYEAMCGRRPFEGMPIPELMKAHVGSTPDRPTDLNPHMSALFEPLLLKTLTKNPEDRFGSAAALISALESVARMAQPQVFDETACETAYDPETNVLTEVWQRPQTSSKIDFLHAFRHLMIMALAMVWSRPQHPTEDPHDPTHGGEPNHTLHNESTTGEERDFGW